MSTKHNDPTQVFVEHTTDNATSRRSLLRLGLGALATALVARSLFMPAMAHAAPAEKTLITFFSRTGNTRAVAEQIQRRVGGDLFELQTTHLYPQEYRATTEQARREQDSNFRPKLTAQINNMDAYNVVFIGYPNWWGTLPMAYFTFLEAYNFSGKTLVPFCTHEGSGLGRGPSDIGKLCPDAKLLKGFAVRGGRATSAQSEVESWLKGIGM